MPDTCKNDAITPNSAGICGQNSFLMSFRICRITRVVLCPVAVAQALDKVPGQEEWKVRCLMSLALCQAEGGKVEDGGKTLQRAYDMAAANKLAGLQKEVAILQVRACVQPMYDM